MSNFKYFDYCSTLTLPKGSLFWPVFRMILYKNFVILISFTQGEVRVRLVGLIILIEH